MTHFENIEPEFILKFLLKVPREFSGHLGHFFVVNFPLFLPYVFNVTAYPRLEINFDLMFLKIFIEQAEIVATGIFFERITDARCCAG
jgi:hypothetical protein